MSLDCGVPRAGRLGPYLAEAGYDRSRLASNVELETGVRVPVAAFSHANHDSRSACIAVLDSTIDSEAEVRRCRSLGAPVVFACLSTHYELWEIGRASCRERV